MDGIGQPGGDDRRIDRLHLRGAAGQQTQAGRRGEGLVEQLVELRRAQQAPCDRPVRHDTFLFQLRAVVAQRHLLDPDDRDREMVADARGRLGGEQPAGAVDDHLLVAALVVGGVDDGVGAVERGGQTVAAAQVGGVVDGAGRDQLGAGTAGRGRVATDESHLVAALQQRARDERAEHAGPSDHRYVHGCSLPRCRGRHVEVTRQREEL